MVKYDHFCTHMIRNAVCYSIWSQLIIYDYEWLCVSICDNGQVSAYMLKDDHLWSYMLAWSWRCLPLTSRSPFDRNPVVTWVWPNISIFSPCICICTYASLYIYMYTIYIYMYIYILCIHWYIYIYMHGYRLFTCVYIYI